MEGAFPKPLLFDNLHCLGPWFMCNPYQSSLIAALPVLSCYWWLVQPLVDFNALIFVTSDWLCNYVTCMGCTRMNK